jgi:hypothetical protein
MVHYKKQHKGYEFPGIPFGIYILTFFLTFFCLTVIPNNNAFTQNNGYEEAVKKYIQTYREIAVREMMEYHIPASIILAQGIYESDAGRSPLSTEANNHFGIKCHKDWTGKTYTQDDEKKNECFRKYNNPEESFRDHSLYLTRQDRYKPLFNLEITDYKGWANGLKSSGYATNPQYATHLIKTIEDYRLYQFDGVDLALVNDSLVPVKDSNPALKFTEKYDVFAEGPGKRMVYLNNGLQFIIFRKNDNIKNVANAFHVSVTKIRKFNDMKNSTPFAAGQMVYLEPKKRKGTIAFHVVKCGETLYTISQTYGVELSRLYKINKLEAGHQVKQGQKILLR